MKPNPTSLSEQFEGHADHACATLAGNVTLEQAADAVERVLVAARDKKIKRLLVDATRVTGFPSPTLAARYFIVRRWATAVGADVELAMVLEQHILDPDRFGVMVAANMGMRADAFSSPVEALEWLRSGRPARVVIEAQRSYSDQIPNQT
jgi:hypothetical protein